jgi:Ca2+-binding RTX toxin-like protein
MDAYNRGYGAKLPGLSDSPGTGLGNAIILTSEGGDAARAVGFYGIAYAWGARTVISYRGTDNLKVLEGENDITNGWVMGAGLASRQAPFAEQFYQRVIGQSTPFANAPDNLILTGHSLGGGLAGYMASLSHGRGIVFDAMPYAASAINRVLAHNLAGGLETFANLRPFLKNGMLDGWSPLPSADKVRSIHVEGEILDLARYLWTTPVGSIVQGAEVSVLVAPALTALSDILLYPVRLAQLGVLGGQALQRLQAQEQSQEIPLPGTSMSQLGAHSQSLLVMLLFATEAGHVQWERGADRLYTALASQNLADSLLLTPEALQTMLAYSVIDEGVRPFGDAAIRALFNDADDLGLLLSRTDLRSEFTTIRQALMDVVVQYAGHLAVEAVLRDGREEGVVDFDHQNLVLRLDFSAPSWAGTTPPEILHKTTILVALTAGSTGLPSLDDVDFVLISTGYDDAALLAPKAATRLDTVLLVGGAGEDVLTGGRGKDLMLGRGGDDLLMGLSGDDYLRGGEGTDTVSFSSAKSGVTVDLITGIAVGEGLDTLISIENLIGSIHADTLTGDIAQNTLRGLDGADRIHGGEGNDVLRGGDGRDFLEGGADQDLLRGARGRDVLDGGSGADILDGGEGSDLFLFTTALDSSNIDLVLDFSVRGGDLIGLSTSIFLDIGAAGTTLLENMFAYGTQAAAPEVRILFDLQTGILVYDQDGDGSALGQIFADLDNFAALVGGNSLSAGQFMLV